MGQGNAPVFFFRSGDSLAPSYDPERVLETTHPSNFKWLARGSVEKHTVGPTFTLYGDRGTYKTHNIFLGVGVGGDDNFNTPCYLTYHVRRTHEGAKLEERQTPIKNKPIRTGRHSHTCRDNSAALPQSAVAFADCNQGDIAAACTYRQLTWHTPPHLFRWVRTERQITNI